MLRFNHMEITLPPGTVARDGAKLAAFLKEAFGFEPAEFPGLDMPYINVVTDPEGSQFLFMPEHPRPMPITADDHLGLHVDSAEEVERILEICRQWQQRDPRVEIRDFGMTDFGRWMTRAFYVRYIFPIWLDVQNIREVATG